MPQDYKKVFYWYKKAVEQGYVLAQGNIATMYELGVGTKKDIIKDRKWYELAAKQGHAQSQNNLALWYYDGKAGLPKDRVKAKNLLQLAAAQGYKPAQKNLAKLYKDYSYLNKTSSAQVNQRGKNYIINVVVAMD